MMASNRKLRRLNPPKRPVTNRLRRPKGFTLWTPSSFKKLHQIFLILFNSLI